MDHVADWMTREVVTITPQQPIATARELMWNHRVRHLPVLDRGRLVGIVSDRNVRGPDMAAAVALSSTQREVLAGAYRPVRTVMATGVQVVWERDTIVYAANLMTEWRISALPVIDGDALVGIISTIDCLRALVALCSAADTEPSNG